MSPPEPARETAVVTRLTFAAPRARTWETLLFYEQIEERPPLYLRLLLPAPIRTEGSKEKVGDEALCLYEGGSLLKRVTTVEPGKHFGFSVVKQDLNVGGGMRLSGGAYTLKELPDGRTEVEAMTRYSSPKRPRWLWEPFETTVCHMFHRHVLREMRRLAEQPATLKGAPT